MSNAVFMVRQEVFDGPFAGLCWKTLFNSGSNWCRVLFLVLAFICWCGCLYCEVRIRGRLRPDQSKLDRILAIGAVYVVSLGILLSQVQSLVEIGAYWRVSFQESRLRRLTQPLFDDWPTEIEYRPGLGRVGPHPQNPNRIFLLSNHGDSLDFFDDLGVAIEKDLSGNAILIELDSGALGDKLNAVLLLRTTNATPDDRLLQTYRTTWSRYWKIAPDMYFIR